MKINYTRYLHDGSLYPAPKSENNLLTLNCLYFGRIWNLEALYYLSLKSRWLQHPRK